MSVPNVNLFLGYVESLKNKKTSDNYVIKNFDKRNFYSANKKFDYVGYVNSGSKNAIDYVEYSGNKEKSHGIFNDKGLLSESEIKELRNNLRNTNSVIWHGVISFTEDFGNTYCDTYEKAYKLMKNEFPKFFKNANLDPNNIEWFAGLHENTDNKHIHFSFFEKIPLRYKRNCKNKVFSYGKINLNAINDFKLSIELKLLNISKELYSQREDIIKTIKDLDEHFLVKNISQLINILPNDGRFSYDSENIKPFKKQIDNVINFLVYKNKDLSKQVSEFYTRLQKHDEVLLKACNNHKIKSNKFSKEKYIEDLYRRVGNIILFHIKEIRSQQNKINYQTNKRLLLKRIEKNKRRILFNQCVRLSEISTKEIILSFNIFLNKLKEADFKRQQEEGYDYEET